jgi:hypothetical protein
MWDKIKASKEKHKNDSMEYQDVKNHFVDEILECFHLTGTKEGARVKDIIMSKCLDQNELVDVANMSFAMTVAKRE